MPFFQLRKDYAVKQSSTSVVRRMSNQLQLNSLVIKEEDQEMDVNDELVETLIENLPNLSSKKRANELTSVDNLSSKKAKMEDSPTLKIPIKELTAPTLANFFR